jgi:hypothetical protein
MNPDLNAATFFAESLRFTRRLHQGVAPVAAVRPTSSLLAREIAWRGHSGSPFKLRPSPEPRRHLVAS